MTRLDWRSEEWGGASYYDPLSDKVAVGKRDVEKGKAHLTLAHELAHRREGLFTNVWSEPIERVFWKELAVWESALDKGVDVSGDDKAFILDSLFSYLKGMEDEYGKDNLQYREAERGYNRFMRRFL